MPFLATTIVFRLNYELRWYSAFQGKSVLCVFQVIIEVEKLFFRVFRSRSRGSRSIFLGAMKLQKSSKTDVPWEAENHGFPKYTLFRVF